MKYLDYLFYKLYRAHEKGSLYDIAEYAAIINFGLLIWLNIFAINGFLTKLNLIPFFYSNGYQAGLAVAVFILISCFYFFHKKRWKNIVINILLNLKSKGLLGIF